MKNTSNINYNYDWWNFDKELMKEFNTLSIVFGTTSDNFVSEENQIKFVKMPAEHPLDGGMGSVEPAPVNPVDSLASQVQEASLLDHNPVNFTPAPDPAPMAAEMDLLGFGTEAPCSGPSRP